MKYLLILAGVAVGIFYYLKWKKPTSAKVQDEHIAEKTQLDKLNSRVVELTQRYRPSVSFAGDSPAYTLNLSPFASNEFQPKGGFEYLPNSATDSGSALRLQLPPWVLLN